MLLSIDMTCYDFVSGFGKSERVAGVRDTNIHPATGIQLDFFLLLVLCLFMKWVRRALPVDVAHVLEEILPHLGAPVLRLEDEQLLEMGEAVAVDPLEMEGARHEVGALAASL